MLNRKVNACKVVGVLLTACLSLGACSSGTDAGAANSGAVASESTEAAEEQQAELDPAAILEKAELSWSGYIMRVDGVEAEDEAITITFGYVSDDKNQDGFIPGDVYTDLEKSPVLLKDADGNEYAYNGALTFHNASSSSLTGTLSNPTPRIGVGFDIPAGTKPEDYVLCVDGNEDLQLVAFVSEAYANEG